MQNEFEKNISQRLQDFSLPPQPEIWQRVEAALPPKKKRRPVFFWWWLILLGLLVGGAWWMIDREPVVASQTEVAFSTKKELQSPVADTPSAPINPLVAVDKTPAQQEDTQFTKTPAPLTQITPAIYSTQTSIQPGQSYRQSSRSKQLIEVAKMTAAKKSALISLYSKKQADLAIETFSFHPKESSGTLGNEGETLASIERLKAEIQPKKDSTATPNPAIVFLPQKDTFAPAATDTAIASQTIVIAKKKTLKNQISWMLETGFGISNLSHSVAGGDKSLYGSSNQLNPSAGSQVGGPAYSQLPPFVLPKSSYSFSLGISRKQAFSLHWQGQLALHYQLLSSTQRYGSYTGAQNSVSGGSRFYSTGDTGTYRNQAHQLRLTPQVAYIIKPTASSPVHLHAGLSVAYNLNANQLLHDYRLGRTYVSSSTYNTRWLLAAEIGAGIFIHQQVFTGIIYQHGLSNVARPALQSDFRWRVWQVQVGLPLFRHSYK